MDSLLPSPRLASPPFRVPFLNAFEYTYVPGGFTSLQGIHRTGYGFSTYGLNCEIILLLPPKERASCLQAWLFFGLISEFFARPVSCSQFVRSISNEDIPIVVVDPNVMSSLSEDWATQLSHLSKEDRGARVAAIMAILDFAAEQSEDFDNNQYGRRDLEIRTDVYTLAVVMLSIKLLISYFRSTVEVYFQAVSKSSPQRWLGEFLSLDQQSSSRTMKQALSSIHKVVGGGDRAKMLIPIPPGGKETLSALLLLNRFRNNRWCPVRAQQLSQHYDYSIINYLSRVQRTDLAHISHQNCESAGVCTAYNLTPQMVAAYKPKHTTSNCTCQLQIIKKDVLTRTIQNGYVPILSMDPQAERLDIRMHHQNGIIPYTAISHVWSDGLGNPHTNGLPLCQLRRLASILTSLKEQKRRETSHAERWYSGQTLFSRRSWMRRVHFWMDTLCIPVDGTNDMRAIKRAAIGHITPIFQGAEQVLVLDSELESLNLAIPSDNQMMLSREQVLRDQEDLTARIIGSKWIQRAWTLEEGALARDCQFLVAGNRTILLGELVPYELISDRTKKKEKEEEAKRIKSAKKNRKKEKKKRDNELQVGVRPGPDPSYTTRLVEFDVPLKLLLAGPLNESRKQAARPGKGQKELKLFMKSRSSQFVDAWNNLLERSATKPDDPVLIFANILDFNAASIEKIDPNLERLPMIVKSCQELPVSLLFNTKKTIRRSGHPKDVWIPSRIEGDRLAHSAIMTKWSATFSSKVGLQIDRSHCAPQSFLVLHSQYKIPFWEMTFCIQAEGVHGWEYYVIEVVPEWRDSNVSEFFLRSCQAAYEEGDGGTCIMIDKATGSESVNAYTGCGAQFSVLGGRDLASEDKISLRYKSPIRAWTYKQWRHNRPSSVIPQSVTNCKVISIDQELILEYDTNDWINLRKQRSLLPSPSLQAAAIRGAVAGVCGIVGATMLIQIFVPKCIDDNTVTDGNGSTSGKCIGLRFGSELAIIIVLGLILYFSWKWYKGRVYNKWLRTFDEKWDRIGERTPL